MKIMGRVAWLILLVVVSVCVVFCVLCCLQTIQCSRVSPYYLIFWKMKLMSYVFWRVSSSIKLQPEKITTGKKRYSRLAIGWNKSQITVCHLKRQTPTITGKNYDRKKRYSRLAVGWNTCQNMNTNYDRKKLWPKKKGTVVLLTPFATHVTFYDAMIWWRHCATHGERGGKAAGG